MFFNRERDDVREDAGHGAGFYAGQRLYAVGDLPGIQEKDVVGLGNLRGLDNCIGAEDRRPLHEDVLDPVVGRFAEIVGQAIAAAPQQTRKRHKLHDGAQVGQRGVMMLSPSGGAVVGSPFFHACFASS